MINKINFTSQFNQRTPNTKTNNAALILGGLGTLAIGGKY